MYVWIHDKMTQTTHSTFPIETLHSDHVQCFAVTIVMRKSEMAMNDRNMNFRPFFIEDHIYPCTHCYQVPAQQCLMIIMCWDIVGLTCFKKKLG